jgi:hypothetical protein
MLAWYMFMVPIWREILFDSPFCSDLMISTISLRSTSFSGVNDYFSILIRSRQLSKGLLLDDDKACSIYSAYTKPKLKSDCYSEMILRIGLLLLSDLG